ncbi:hypothetical protein VP02_17985 [Pseudomonas ogarae]|uniref:Methyl-accepting chemotaxis protein n=1 Tax=Pseudomonas kilonensis TaxID=132476 RepID=A0A0F4XL12_9PSED|nr:hypothetical protein VP02_17985 [Pseudomonas ogarae]
MAGSVSQINSLSTQIATAAEQQSAVTEKINRSMVQIRHMVEELVDGGLTADLALAVVHPSDLFEQDLWEQSLLARRPDSRPGSPGRTQIPLWGASLLAMAGSASMDVEWADAFASKLAHRTLFTLAT